ncbi:diguanylate cyclase [Porphyrobacter sp. YT40]|uniref:GGDEF domain-containing protein n=1 Tax=Porphyrobacter sp. YT40 TaxID=2547601 RepID=UPI0011422AFD|nr:diguanylate cyclase [Porphyrobacter sp. YT40]QDH32906.1 diguanylate cyclase [Porphyrobacter sp. YT40]
MGWGIHTLRKRFVPPIPAAIRDDFTLLRARRVETQTPMMYLMLLATTPTAAWAGAADLHWGIKYGMPALLAVLCVLGLIENKVSRSRHLSLRRARLIVKKTASVSGWVGVMCSTWAVLNWFASPIENHASFAMIIAMGSLATAYCLSAIRFAAILNLVIGVVPISALMFASGRPAEVGAAMSLVLGTAILVRFILQGHAMLVDLLQLQHQTRDLAHTDPLTCLANRRALDERVAALLAKGAGKGADAPGFKLALLDLDGFKPVNDVHGHAIGDKLLCAIADRLRETIGDDGLVARQGGDEFAVLIPPHSPLRDAPLAERILIALARPHDIDDVLLQVGASIGVAQWPEDGGDADALFEFADRALYQVKAETRAESPSPALDLAASA